VVKGRVMKFVYAYLEDGLALPRCGREGSKQPFLGSKEGKINKMNKFRKNIHKTTIEN
jgi:hypothetical protein